MSKFSYSKNPQKARVAKFCSNCASRVGTIQPTCMPFTIGDLVSTNNWIKGNMNILHGLCETCKNISSEKTIGQYIKTWEAGYPCMIETEVRVKQEIPGTFEYTPQTQVEYHTRRFRIRDGVAIAKSHLSTEVVFDQSGGFVRKVTSLESWPLSIHSALKFSGEKINWAQPTIMHKIKNDDGTEDSCIANRHGLSTIQVREKEECDIVQSDFFLEPNRRQEKKLYTPSVDIVKNEFAFEKLPNQTFPARVIPLYNIKKTRGFYSPKIDGLKVAGTFTQQGLLVHDHRCGESYMIFLEYPEWDITNAPQVVVELVKRGDVKYFFIIDVCIDAEAIERIKFIQWIEQAFQLDGTNLFCQQYFEDLTIDGLKYISFGEVDQKYDGIILTPVSGRHQLKIKTEWTVDLYVDGKTKTLASIECAIAKIPQEYATDFPFTDCICEFLFDPITARFKFIRKRSKPRPNTLFDTVCNMNNQVEMNSPKV